MLGASNCPAPADLERLVLGQLGDTESEALAGHLDRCPRCLDTLRELRCSDSILDALAVQSSIVDSANELAARLRGALAETLSSLGDGMGSAATLAPLAGGNSAAPEVPGYEILAELGRGGMGVVYKARQTGLDRLVALKMILAGSHAGTQLLQRFRAEAAAIARLRHPNIVQIHAIDQVAGQPFFALEYCGGGNLHERLRSGPVPPDESAWLVEQLADAMQAAHSAGIIHRDLKPANVLLQIEDGQESASCDLHAVIPKISDFGLAKNLDADDGATQSGALLGTPNYMAPEQARGDLAALGPATDIHALGGILYSCLTGYAPFQSASVLDTLELVRGAEPVPPRQLQPKVPRDLETICLKCMRKEPARRYLSAAELADDLRRFRAGEPIRARPAGRVERALKWVRRRPALAALYATTLVAAAVLVGMAFWFTATMGIERGKTQVAETQAAAARELAQTREFFALLSQVRERRAEPRPGWTWQSLDDLARAAKLPPAREHAAELRSEAAAALTAPDLRLARVVGEGFVASTVAFDPKGRYLALGQERAQAFVACAVQLIDLADGDKPTWLSFTPSALVQSLLASKQEGVRALVFSPDGRWLAAGTMYGALHLWDLADPARPRLTRQAHQGPLRWLAFDPSGAALFSAAEDNLVKRWSAAAWQETAQHRAATDIVGMAVHPREGWVACSTSGEDKLWSLSGDTLEPLRGPVPGCSPDLQFAPGGDWLVRSAGDVFMHIVETRTGSFARQIGVPEGGQAHDGRIRQMAFSPDGALLLSCSADARQARLWDVGSGRLVADVAAGLAQAAFAPDGRRLAVAGRQTRLYEVASCAEQEVHVLQRTWLRAAALAPEGHALATIVPVDVEDCGSVQAWTLPLQGCLGPVTTTWLRDLNEQLTFAPGGGIGVVAGKLTVLQPLQRPLDWGAAPTAQVRQLTFAPDGRLWSAEGGDIVSRAAPSGQVMQRWSSSTVRMFTGSASPVALAAGRRWVVGGGSNGFAYILRAADAGQQAVPPVSASPLRSVALGPGETQALVGSDAGELSLLSLPAGQVVARANAAHRDKVTALAFSEQLLISGARDRTIKLWRRRADKLEELLTLRLEAPVRWLALHPDGVRLFVLHERDAAIRVWHLDRLWRRLSEVGIDTAGVELRAVEPPAGPHLEAPSPTIVPPDGPHGLKAELYADLELRRPVKVRYDPQVHFDWNQDAPDADLPADNFSIRWTGWLKAPKPGFYTLRLEADDYARVWLDDKVIIDWRRAGPAFQEIRVPLSDGPHALRLEFCEGVLQAHCRLLWAQADGFPMQPIPREALFHDRAAATQRGGT